MMRRFRLLSRAVTEIGYHDIKNVTYPAQRHAFDQSVADAVVRPAQIELVRDMVLNTGPNMIAK